MMIKKHYFCILEDCFKSSLIYNFVSNTLRPVVRHHQRNDSYTSFGIIAGFPFESYML
jgi:hypothetical protein